MLMDQVAFYCTTKNQEERVKGWFNLQNAVWIHDTVTGLSSVRQAVYAENVAELQFNGDLGLQLEIIRYVKGQHWLLARPDFGIGIIVSHVGLHLADDEPWPAMGGAQLVQHTRTTKHTGEHFHNSKLPTYGRTYEYKIFESQPYKSH
jgi:hypothetical protein